MGTKAARSQLWIISSVSTPSALTLYPIGCNAQVLNPYYTLLGIKLKLASIATLQYSLNIAFPIEDFPTQYGNMPCSSEHSKLCFGAP